MTQPHYLRARTVRRTFGHMIHVMAPTLVALSLATVAHAQGTMDFSGAQTLMGTFKTFAMYAGAVICLGGLIFAGIRMMSGRFQDAIPGLFGALFGAGVLGWGAGWIGFDHGYAVTSHSSQGLTTTRVLAHFDTEAPRGLVNTRLAYVAISRASHDAHIYTNDAENLGKRLASDVTKSAAVDFKTNDPSRNVDQAIASFRAGNPDQGIGILRHQGRVQEYANPEHRAAAVALDYVSSPHHTVVVAADAEERRELTRLIRDELWRRAKLQGEVHTIPVSAKQDFGTGRLASRYSPGDRIHYTKGDAALGIAENSEATVLRVNGSTNHLTITTRDGSEVSYNPSLTRRMTSQSTVFRDELREFAMGDRVRLTEPGQNRPARSGDFATVKHIGDDHSVTLRHDNGRTTRLVPEETKSLDHAYAVAYIREASTHRVIITEDSPQFAAQANKMKGLSTNTHDVTVYTSINMDPASTISMKDIGRQDFENHGNRKIGQLASGKVAAVDFDGIGIGR